MTKTLGSRSISSRSASRMRLRVAALGGMVASVRTRSRSRRSVSISGRRGVLEHVDVLLHLGRVGHGRGQGELGGLFNGLVRPCSPRRPALPAWRCSASSRLLAEHRQRVAIVPVLLLFLGAVLARVRARVAVPAIGLALDERGPLAPARACHGLGDRLVDGQHVHAIDHHAGHVVGRGARGDVGHARSPCQRAPTCHTGCSRRCTPPASVHAEAMFSDS